MKRSELKKVSQELFHHRYGMTLFIFLSAAAVTGVACVLFMWAFEFVLQHRLDFQHIGWLCWITTPLLFLFSVWLIRRFAPCAEGTGIPQTIFAAEHLTETTKPVVHPLVSMKTMSIKVIALLIGLWAGASTGREGPTVHVAACLFFGIVFFLRRWTKISLDLRSAVVAGGAAGLAAAFNTPLAGVTFAIEELSTDYFSTIKDFVLMAIIVAGIAAQFLTGEYTYFGRLTDSSHLPLSAILLVGVLAGAAGVFFTTVLMEGKRFLNRFSQGKRWYLLPIVLSLGVLLIAAVSQMDVLGPGNKAAQILVEGQYASWVLSFPVLKMAATLLTYWSGVAGGIFAPCLSMGSCLGADIGHWMNISVAACALVGMAAFLSGAIQAPITAFVIIFEMSGHHQMLLPIMLASLIAYMTARILGAKHFYQALASSYENLLEPAKGP